MNKTNFYHALLAVAAQAVLSTVLLTLGVPALLAHIPGGLFSVGFYLGREVAQAEYKLGRDPWWQGFKFHLWSKDALYDLIFPVVGCVLFSAVWVVATA